MKRADLKKALKPIIKECIKEVIFEEGVLSGLITEVVQGLGSVDTHLRHVSRKDRSTPHPNENIRDAKSQLNEYKSKLQKASGLKGVFEGITPLPARKNRESTKYGALRDKDPTDAGVNIEGLLKMTGGWSHLT